MSNYTGHLYLKNVPPICELGLQYWYCGHGSITLSSIAVALNSILICLYIFSTIITFKSTKTKRNPLRFMCGFFLIASLARLFEYSMGLSGNMYYKSKAVLHIIGTSSTLSAFTCICYIWVKTMAKAKLFIKDDYGPVIKIKYTFISVTVLLWLLLFLGPLVRWTADEAILFEVSSYIEAAWILIITVGTLVTSTRVFFLARANPTKKLSLKPYFRMTICIWFAAMCGFVLLVIGILQSVEAVLTIASMIVLRILNCSASFLAFLGFIVFNPSLNKEGSNLAKSMIGRRTSSSPPTTVNTSTRDTRNLFPTAGCSRESTGSESIV